MDTVATNVVELWWILQNNWASIGGLLGFGAFFATVIQYVKSKFKLDERVLRFTKNIKIGGKGLVNILLLVMTVVATILETATQLFDIFPNAAVALPTIYLFITQVHRLVVSPIWSNTREKLEEKKQQEADAKAYRELVAVQKERTVSPALTSDATVTDAAAYNPVETIQG